MNNWRKDIASCKIGKNLYLSIPFTWLFHNALDLIYKHKGPVYAGGPAVDLMPDFFSRHAFTHEPAPFPPLSIHNPIPCGINRWMPLKRIHLLPMGGRKENCEKRLNITQDWLGMNISPTMNLGKIGNINCGATDIVTGG